MKRVNVALAAATLAGLGAVVGTIAVGSRVREDTVVEKPYEEGLRHDAERRARAALGLTVSLPGEPLEAGSGPLVFALAERGAPLEDAAVTVGLSRPETSRDARSAPARATGGGRFVADLALPAAGPWDLRFDVVRGEDRVRLERRVVVRAACDLGEGPCTRPLAGGGEVTLELSPRPPRTMRELVLRAEVRERGAPLEGARVSASFSMPGMEMGENRVALAPVAPGRYEGSAVLVRCPTGRKGWVADVTVEPGGAPAREARFPLTVAE